MENAERRVLALTNPDAIGGRNTTTNLNGCLQVLMPGESARPHRHTPNALRFVLEGGGATTVVDGKRCPMARGRPDHHARHVLARAFAMTAPRRSSGSMRSTCRCINIWAPRCSSPGRPRICRSRPTTQLSRCANIVPELPARIELFAGVPLSVGRIGRGARRRAARPRRLAQDPLRQSDDRRPGDVAARLLHDAASRPGAETIPYRTTSNAVGVVVEGSGRAASATRLLPGSRRTFSACRTATGSATAATSGSATLFVVTDREVLRRLDLLSEEYGNERAL